MKTVTLEERLRLAREIAARTRLRVVIAESREAVRRTRFKCINRLRESTVLEIEQMRLVKTW